MKGRAALSRRKVPFAPRDLFKEPLSAAEIRALAARAPDGVRSLLSTRSTQYKALGLDRKKVTDAELIALMAKEPRLLRRPILDLGDRLVIGFDQAAYEAVR
ncbi:MAG TPA: ArsC/Spx/MgsR family protein [Methylomirabilota bacterium]|nr:ArsC/Spx/MgsR family protein [Methylomirabilota bacterium]